MTQVSYGITLAWCQSCREPMQMVNGQPRTAVEFFQDENGKARIRAHSAECTERME